MPLKDDPALLRGPTGFAVRVNHAVALDVGDARRRLPGLLKFARTFIAVVLEAEFDTPIAGFPRPARERAAALSARLKRDQPASRRALRLAMCVVDVCDLEIDRHEMSGDDDDDDQEAYHDEILVMIQRLLDRFGDWIDAERLPQLASEARRARAEFAAACGRLRSP
jgi:hypothetical protein